MEQLHEFHKSCFNHFLNLKGQLIQLIGLSLIQCADNNLLEFSFGGIGARFAERDFALVTILKFSRDIDDHNFAIEDIKKAHIRTKYLKNVDNYDKETQEELFEKYEFKDDNDAMKMALLNFMNTGLLGYPHKSKINMMFVSLVEDVAKFNNYPWRTYVYGEAVAALNGLF